MGEAQSDAKPIEAPALQPLPPSIKLAPTPRRAPKYAVTVRATDGSEVTLGDPRATRALVALMNVHAVHGGAACHWGGPAAFAEINAAVHGLMFAVEGREWFEAYNYVNDAGHAENGVYALRANLGFDGLTFDDLRGFRSIDSKLTGHGESHLNPEGVLLSNGPLGSSLPQAQGLALADKTRGNDRVTLAVVSDGASMEGEAKEAFAAIPGLAARGRLNPFVLIISDNDTKLSGRISQDSFPMAPTFAAMTTLGWHVIEVPQGHDLQSVYQAVEQGVARARANPNKPVCLHVKTIKGYGVKATEESASGGHGFPLKGGHQVGAFVDEIWGGQTPEEFVVWSRELAAAWEAKEAAKKAKPANPDAPKKEKVQSGLARGAIQAALAGHPVFSVSSDVQGSTGVADFQKTFPDRWIEVGVAEANMVSTGAGLAKMGYIPIVDTFAQFGITKGNLPLTMAALSQAPVIGVFSHVGLQDAADGASHQATTYLAATSAIPHTVVIACSCSGEAESLMFQAIERIATERRAGRDGESVVFFVGRENYPQQWVENPAYPWGKAQVVREGTDVVLVGCGTLFGKAVEAGEQLAAEGIQATVINNPFINRVDVGTIGAAVTRCGGRLVTIEDHQLSCGMGAQLSHALSNSGVAHRLKSLAIPGEFGQSAYLAEHLYVKHGMTAAKMAEAAKALLAG
ncbi:MAG: transketolase [Verrucomicrobiales bacterium]|nr:transketolase [Verrucomicrobiales bacterium]